MVGQDYELLDFGKGRKLERFGTWILDRPAPAAEDFSRANKELWSQAHLRFERTSGEQGNWIFLTEMPGNWEIEIDQIRLSLRPTPFGHVGFFPEQISNWQWLRKALADFPREGKILNLFAYTGGSSLLVASQKVEIAHVDAVRGTVAWARENARLSSLNDRPIRWLVEDARRFVERELRRGNRYEGVILDPPSYGHGPKGVAWHVERDLEPLMEACAELTADRLKLLNLSCHSPGFGPERLQGMLKRIFGLGRVEAAPLDIIDSAGRKLPCGAVTRWSV